MSTLGQPLINAPHDRPSEDDEGAAAWSDSEQDLDVLEASIEKPGLFVWALTIAAGVSGLLFGYEYVPPAASSNLFILTAQQHRGYILYTRLYWVLAIAPLSHHPGQIPHYLVHFTLRPCRLSRDWHPR